MPPAGYLAASYYEKWLHALEALLVEKGVVTREELVKRTCRGGRAGHGGRIARRRRERRVESFDSSAVKLRFNKSYKPGFKVGDRVVARNFNPEHHTRLPRYARGKRGVIRYDHGVFVFPDTHAYGQGGKPQHVYTVAFEARELWGPDQNQRAPVYLDCWEDYLERDRAAAKPAVKSAPKAAGKRPARAPAKPPVKTRTAKFATKARASKPAARPKARSRAAARKGRKR